MHRLQAVDFTTYSTAGHRRKATFNNRCGETLHTKPPFRRGGRGSDAFPVKIKKSLFETINKKTEITGLLG